MAFWSQNDAYAIHDTDDDSSDINSSSSEDEIDIILHGTAEQKKKLKRIQDRVNRRRRGNNVPSSSEDEFEKEMNAELAQQVSVIEKSRGNPKAGGVIAAVGSEQSTQGNNQSDTEAFYDDVYFDSDEEENDGPMEESRKHAVISNDDLLYDPTMDDKDQKWVDKQRRRNNNTRLNTVLSQNRKKPAKLPTSDALLDCPACLTTLCLDCQRHETYKHQYRAMFVMNCEVDYTQKLECPDQQTKRKKKKKMSDKGNSSAHDGNENSDLFNPVKCTECSTVVGVIDSDEVYHFFNIIASHT